MSQTGILFGACVLVSYFKHLMTPVYVSVFVVHLLRAFEVKGTE